MQKQEKKGKLPPFSAFFFSMVFFFLLLEEKKMPRRKAETRGQKWEPKVKGQSESLKESSFHSLHFFSSLWPFFFFFFLILEKKKMPGENV
jgi:hypothetical protein